MPNGHGGMPRYGAPFCVFCLILASLLCRKFAPDMWRDIPFYFLAIWLGWKLSWHIRMWNVSEYDGNTSTQEAVSRAAKRRSLGLLLYPSICCLLTYLLLATLF